MMYLADFFFKRLGVSLTGSMKHDKSWLQKIKVQSLYSFKAVIINHVTNYMYTYITKLNQYKEFFVESEKNSCF